MHLHEFLAIIQIRLFVATEVLRILYAHNIIKRRRHIRTQILSHRYTTSIIGRSLYGSVSFRINYSAYIAQMVFDIMIIDAICIITYAVMYAASSYI